MSPSAAWRLIAGAGSALGGAAVAALFLASLGSSSDTTSPFSIYTISPCHSGKKDQLGFYYGKQVAAILLHIYILFGNISNRLPATPHDRNSKRAL